MTARAQLTDRRDRRDDLAKLQLVQDGRLTCEAATRGQRGPTQHARHGA